jgi:O-antigen/teichoic acid export membrane protein
VVIVFSIIGAVVLAGSWWVTNTALQAGMRAFAFGVLAEQIWVHVAAATRARGKFRRFALNEVLNGVLHVAVAWMLAAAFGLNGAYFGFVLVTAIAGGLLLHSAPIRLAWSTPRLKQLLRVGVPMLALLTAALVLGTVDRLVVAAYRGTEQLGVYAFAVAVGSLANTLALIVRTVIFPSVYAGASDAGAGRAVEAHLRRALRPFALFVPPLLGVAAIALGPVIVMLVPQYADAAVPARFFVFTGVATGLVTLTTIAAVATERQALLPAYAVVGVVLNIALSVMALEAGLGLPAVALAALLSQSTYAGLVLFVMARAGGHATPARAAASVLMPVLWCVVAMVITQRLFPMLTVGSALRGLAVFALLISPLAPSVLKTLRERLSAGPARG